MTEYAHQKHTRKILGKIWKESLNFLRKIKNIEYTVREREEWKQEYTNNKKWLQCREREREKYKCQNINSKLSGAQSIIIYIAYTHTHTPKLKEI